VRAHLDIEPGTEWILPWARNKLQQLESMRRGPVLRNVTDGPDGIRVFLRAAGDMSSIRITGGRKLFMITTRSIGGSNFEVKLWDRSCKSIATFTLAAPISGFLQPFIDWEGSKGAVASVTNLGGTTLAFETAAIPASATSASVVTVNPFVSPINNNIGQRASGKCRDLYAHELFPQTTGLNAVTTDVTTGVPTVSASGLLLSGKQLPYSTQIPPAQMKDGYDLLSAFGGYDFNIPRNRYDFSRAGAYVMRDGVWSSEVYDDQAYSAQPWGGLYVLLGSSAAMSDDGNHTFAVVGKRKNIANLGVVASFTHDLDFYRNGGSIGSFTIGSSVQGNELGQPTSGGGGLWVNQNGTACIFTRGNIAYNGSAVNAGLTALELTLIVWDDGTIFPIVPYPLTGTVSLMSVGVTNDRQLAVFYGYVDGGIATQRFHFYRFNGSSYVLAGSTSSALSGTCFFNPVNGKVFLSGSTCREIAIDDNNVVTIASTPVVGGPIGSFVAVAASLI